MAKAKYSIKREFFPFTLFTPPMNPRMIAMSQKMGMPGFVGRDPDLDVRTVEIPGYQGGAVTLHILTPKALQAPPADGNAAAPAPCLVAIHGGGFVFEAFSSHYRHAMTYAKEAGCVVVFVRYRLAPAHPFPVPQEDCYAALLLVHDHAGELGIDPDRIGIGGDSAGGTLTVTSCMMARDRGAAVKPLFQLLIYPWLDDRNASDSYHRYTDTPMWNSTLSKAVGPLINPNPSATPLAYRSPAEADSFAGLPPAYIEVAQFDCLHDDGALYAEELRRVGIPVEFHETEGTMHGFDTKVSAPTTKAMVAKRAAFLKRMFWGE